MKKAIAQTCLSAMALAITASSAWAQTPAMQAQAGMSSLSYSVVDLDMADGVDAGIVFQPLQADPDTVFIGERSNPFQENVVQGTAPFNLFAGANYALGLPSGRGTVAIGNDSATAYTQLSMADVEGALRGDFLFNGMSSYTTTAGFANRIELVDSANPDFAQLSNFILSPHTRLVLEGTFDAQTFFERSSIDPALLASASSAPGSALYFDLSGETSLMAYLQNGPFEMAEHYAYENHAFEASGWRGEGVAGPAVSFQLVLTNDSDEYRGGVMRYFAATNARVTLMAAPFVPEPGTWATFALGLGFVGAAVARQRKRQA